MSDSKLIAAEIMFKKTEVKKTDKSVEYVTEFIIFFTNGSKITHIIPSIYEGFEYDKHYSLTDVYGNSKVELPVENV